MIETECRVLALSTVSFQQKNNIYVYEPKRNIKKKKEDKKKNPLLCERGVTTVQYYKTEPVCNKTNV